jgi:hypothetical protein
VRAWADSGDAQQQQATRRELLLLNVVEICRKRQREEILNGPFRALLAKLRAGPKETFSVTMGDQLLDVGYVSLLFCFCFY